MRGQHLRQQKLFVVVGSVIVNKWAELPALSYRVKRFVTPYLQSCPATRRRAIETAAAAVSINDLRSMCLLVFVLFFRLWNECKPFV